MFERALIFAAHADDELTMSGTIWRMSQTGGSVHVVVMTDGSEGYPRPDLRDEIVAIRKREAAACDKVMGIAERAFLDQPDMGLVPSKQVTLRCLEQIRRIRPDVIFTHGPADKHPDHRATHRCTIDAQWQAGQPVCAELGEPWRTPIVYYYKGVSAPLPRVTVDVSDAAHKRFEALATQESQHTLFGMTKEELLSRARELRRNPQQTHETFWIAESNTFSDFLKPQDAR